MREPMIDTCSTQELDVPPATSPPAPAPFVRTYLLTSGIAKCGLCGENLEGKPNRKTTPGYACTKAVPGHSPRPGCGKIYISAEPLNEYIAGKVLAWCALRGSMRKMQALVTKSMRTGSALTDEIEAVKSRIRQLAVDHAKGDVPDSVFKETGKALDARWRELRAEVKQAVQLDALPPLKTPEDLADWWNSDATTVQQKHDLVRVLIDEIRIMPSQRRGFRGVQPERVQIVWNPATGYRED